MGSPENRLAHSYFGNLVSRLSGREVYRYSKATGTKDPGVDAFCKVVFFPAMDTPHPKNPDKWVFHTARMYTDILIDTFLVSIIALGHPVEGIGLKVAYNVAVEVIPDALRSVRRINPFQHSTLAI